MDIGASVGELPSKVSYLLRQDKQAVYLYEIKLPHDCRTMEKYKHNLGHSKGLKNMVTKYARISS
jgi:ABC-type transport system involved in cytochrome c biogenesis ATPase subunit